MADDATGYASRAASESAGFGMSIGGVGKFPVRMASVTPGMAQYRGR